MNATGPCDGIGITSREHYLQAQIKHPENGDVMHIAAVFETLSAAYGARDALVGAGIPAEQILVLDRGSEAETPAPRGLLATIKARLRHGRDPHAYAEAVTRGHPLLVADIDDAHSEAAVSALNALHPIDLTSRAETWRAEGWDGTYSGDAWEAEARDNPVPAGSDGLVQGGVIAGDYGAVGAPLGSRANTDILRGKSGLYRQV
jgi:hypothetical protein